MKLWIERGVATTWWGTASYELRIGIDADLDELAIIESHGLGDIECWASPAALGFDSEAEHAFAAAHEVTGWDFAAIGTWIGHNRAGLRAKRDGEREARVTVADLVAGHVLAGELSELVAAEKALRSAFVGLVERVAAAESYGNGEEAIVLPPAPPDADRVPPALWPMRRMR